MKIKIAVLIILCIIAIGATALTIYALIAYGGKPITEIPTWAFWLIHTSK